MKKIIVIVAALLMGIQANAQFVASAGYIHAFESFNHHHPANLDGIFVGGNYYYSLDNLVDGLAVLPGVNLSALFGRYYEYNFIPATIKEIALNLPVQASYTHEINETIKVFGQSGPTIQVGLSHRGKWTELDTHISNLYKPHGEGNLLDYQRSRFQIYWGVAAGVEISDLFRIDMGYDFGLFGMSLTKDYSIRRGYLHLGVGYLF